MQLARRDILKAAALAAVPARAAESRYQLACETLPYRGFPMQRALEGIRKAGYQYVCPTGRHANDPSFSVTQSASERAELKRRFADAGLKPVMAMAGLGIEFDKPGGIEQYCKELDLCADFGIRVNIGAGPWYYTKWPNIPMRDRDWQPLCDRYLAAMEKCVRHAETVKVIVAMKPHTGLTANAKTCMKLVQRLVSPSFQICWDAGNVSFYEGIWPDPDLPDLMPHVKGVCLKDHKGLRGEANFPTPGQGQIDHEGMFRTLFAGGFNGPLALERVDGTDRAAQMTAEVIDQRIEGAYQYLAPLLEKTARG